MPKLHTAIDPRYALAGFKQFVEDDVNSLDPKGANPGGGKKADYLDTLGNELGWDWKTGVMKDKLVVLEPIEVGGYVYKTSAWKVLNTDDKFVTIQLDPAGTPNLYRNVFLKKPDGQMERLGPNSPLDTDPKTIPREVFSKMLDAAWRASQQGGGAPPGPGGAPPAGGPPGAGAAPPPPGM